MIVFQNPGLIDMAAVTTLGVSVKDGDGAIGYFGTGLKFAIATILRNGGKVAIYSGAERHEFAMDRDTIRGQEFDFVTMDGSRLGFTTQLGRNWKPWMAFRELASNCKDEGGCYWSGDEYDCPADHTTIAVTGIDDVWAERRTIMLEGKPIVANEHVEVREGISQYVFYRGVRIHTAPRPSAFTYNILGSLELTEDRTAKYGFSVEQKIERGIGAIDDRPMLRKMMTCGQDFWEHHLDVPAYGLPSAAFREVARELAMGSETVKSANPKAVAMARASAIQDLQEGDSIDLDLVQTRMIAKASDMLHKAGFRVKDFPIIVCDTLGPNICGMAKDGKIFLSLLPFQKGTREVAATLLEEYSHLKSGEGDATLGFQNWLFDQLLVQAERAAGEPF